MRKKQRPFKMILIGLLCSLWLIPMWFEPPAAFAETGTVIIASDTSIQVGDTLYVTVKYAASSLGSIDGELRYDPDMLKFVSGGTSSDPAGGVVKMTKELAGEASQIFTIRFVAVGAGSDFFVVNTFQLKDDNDNDLGKPGASVKLTVTKVAASQDPEEPVVVPEEPSDNPTTETPDSSDDPAAEAPVVDDEPVNNPNPTNSTETDQEAPDTMWVILGAIGATTALLVLALILVNRRRKPN
jgi:hypothetical protein